MACNNNTSGAYIEQHSFAPHNSGFLHLVGAIYLNTLAPRNNWFNCEMWKALLGIYVVVEVNSSFYLRAHHSELKARC